VPRKTGVTGALTGLTGLLALALPAGAVPRCGPLDLDVLRLDPPPSQYTDFCEREPGACAMWGEPVLDWTEERHDTLARINASVNDEIEFVSDQDNLGQEEVWSFPADCRGDCEDFALEKRRRLVALGFPPAALTMAIAFHELELFPHAILLAETTRGTWVLDNLHDDLLCWDALPYRFTRRERPDGLWTRFALR
jgi:predicted transglutaminase-like cysteine proteinase